MPAFGEAIDEDGRWALIDFLHANADAAHVRNFGAGDLLSVPIPHFACEVANASTLSTAQLRGQIIYILFASSRSPVPAREVAALDLAAMSSSRARSRGAGPRQRCHQDFSAARLDRTG